jgi:predicted AlkP superfamily phosphohydrolase/phosphomutase
MSQRNGPAVLAIAIDAAESTLIRRMIEEGQLPAVKALLSQGSWRKVKAPAEVGSGSVWPTFMTGRDPSAHGVYGEWCWHSDTMSLSRFQGSDFIPFWKRFADDGITVGVLDLPFMPMLGLREGFEISEWGPHDVAAGYTQINPKVIKTLVSQTPAHALSLDRLDSEGQHDREHLTRLASSCLEGIKTRGALAERLIRETKPDFALITFTEVHHTAHYLWHALEPEDEVYAGEAFQNLPAIKPDLREIYGEVDRQIGALINTCPEGTRVMVFALHGMQAAHGVPAFLAPLLREWGFAKLADWRGRSWTGRATSLLAAAKRHAPAPLKKLYYRTLPSTTTQALARPTMLEAYDWSQTRAFSLPSDQHGWIRINLKGREAKGIVTIEEYDKVCGQLEVSLRALTTVEGKPLVRKCLRTCDDASNALAHAIPDLVVHWENAVFASQLRIKGSEVEGARTGTKFTGHHALDGFCILKGFDGVGPGETLRAEELGKLIASALTSLQD